MFPDEIKADVERIRSELIEKVAEGPGEVSEYVRFILAENDFNDEDCDKMAKMAFAVANGDITKYAKKKGKLGKSVRGAVKDVDMILGTASKGVGIWEKFRRPPRPTIGSTLLKSFPVALGAGIMGILGMKKILDDKKAVNDADSVFGEIMNENTGLRADPNMTKYYNSIKKFAPHMASDKNILENALQHAHEFGRLEYPVVKDLISMQAGVKGQPSSGLQEATSLSTIGKTVAIALNPVSRPQDNVS